MPGGILLRDPLRLNPTSPLPNRILGSLPASERAILLSQAEYVVIPAGLMMASPGEVPAAAFFPDRGAFCWLGDMSTGHHVAVAIVGTDGLVGISSVLAITRHNFRAIALFESSGYRLPAESLRRAFKEFVFFRAGVLAYVGRQIIEISSHVACNRIHSHSQRLARWLLMMADKSGSTSLKITHEVLAQVVGGPRHAVTMGLNKLGTEGAIAHLRGQIDILDRVRLRRNACECYAEPDRSSGAGDDVH
jgi:CRP-like cAMP-binding protein